MNHANLTEHKGSTIDMNTSAWRNTIVFFLILACAPNVVLALSQIGAASTLSEVLRATGTHAAQLDILGPVGSREFGKTVTLLPNGNFVVTDPQFDLPGPVSNVGAVYLYSPTGALISTLTGSAAGDRVGDFGVTILANGNYVIRSIAWNGQRGAVTWGSAAIGVSGTVDVSNSLTSKFVNGTGEVIALSNGNYVVNNNLWMGVGAVTWGNGTVGTVGLISTENSLVGGTANDRIGANGVTVLSNGNYVVRSPFWDGPGQVVDVGAVTWGDGMGGTAGLVSAINSLVGGSENDQIGFVDQIGFNGVIALNNGHYVVSSPAWDATGPVAFDVGAVTWGNGAGGTVGLVSATNSLVGTKGNEAVGNGGGVTALSNGHYVVSSPFWAATATEMNNMGAVTWCSGTGGTVGLVSAANSLVGGTANDLVGSSGVIALSNGHYVVSSIRWSATSPAVSNVGAVTWGNGTGGTVGLVNAANSLVGSTPFESIGERVTMLSNGNYVVRSSGWDATGPAVTNVGAVTWGNGMGGTIGLVSEANSLVGGSTFDFNGIVITALSNGNYVVVNSEWDSPSPELANVGAVTWGNGIGGTIGLISAANSLVGGTTNDQVGSRGITALSNGNYAVSSINWDAPGSRAIVDAGAVTWGNGVGGTVGLVDSANSLVGGADSDFVGFGVTALSNGSYVVASGFWDAPDFRNVGAVTWGSGTGGTIGLITPANSLIGSKAFDAVSGTLFGGGIAALSNGDYVVRSHFWDGPGMTVDSGATSLAAGDGRTIGLITTYNSVLGTATSGGSQQVFAYDALREQLIVGRSSDNIVTIFSDRIFLSGFED